MAPDMRPLTAQIGERIFAVPKPVVGDSCRGPVWGIAGYPRIKGKRILTRIAPLVCCAVVLVLAGCVSGQVTDAVTGQPIAGATITFHDAEGNAGAVTTGEAGLYSLNGLAGPKPAAGLVQFEVSAPGYATLRLERDLQYDDNEQHTQAIESFYLVPGGG